MIDVEIGRRYEILKGERLAALPSLDLPVVYVSEVEPKAVPGATYAFRMQYGSKLIEVGTNDDRRTTETYVQTIGEQEDHIAEETTYLYRQAKRIMDATAQKHSAEYAHSFITESPLLLGWAKSKGGEVFDWAVEPVADSAPPWKFVSKIHP